MQTTLLIVSDAGGREVAAVFDGPDVAALTSGEWTRREVSAALAKAASACQSPLRRISLAEASGSLAYRIDLSMDSGQRSTPATVLTVRRVDASVRARPLQIIA